ncbi:hypothetical protein [Clostridium sp. Marseille-Q7071]
MDENIEDLFNEDSSNIRLKKIRYYENGTFYSTNKCNKYWENIESLLRALSVG